MSRKSQLAGKVIVITGASSGIGRAAAAQLARRGASLVLAARREAELEETARMCRSAGGAALVVPTDVTREHAVKALADRAMEHFGRIDVWINNAGVTLFGLLEQGPFEEHRRVIETNLFGAMHGARAVVPIFRQQKQGVLINVGSILSKLGQPFVPSYVISKFGMRGLSEALRAELADLPDVHVCSIFPYAIDTQHFESGANHYGHAAHAMPPVLTPARVATALVELVEKPRRERHVPRAMAFGVAFRHLFPRAAERLILDVLRRWHFDDQREPDRAGNLFVPSRRPASLQGERPPRIDAPTLMVWILGHVAKRQLRAVAKAPARLTRAAEALA